MNESIIKGISKLVINEKKTENCDQQKANDTTIDAKTAKNRSKSDDKPKADKKSNGKSSSDESSTSSAASPQTSSFDSNEDMTDYYLSLSVCQCLKSNRNTLKDPTLFWKSVSNKMMSEYKLNVMDDKECQTRFEELLQLYINVLKTAKDSIEANDVFKCFGIFNTIDLNLFLTQNVYQSVVDLRYKLWNGVKHKTSPMRRPDASPMMPSAVPYLSYGLTQNQMNYLAYYGYFPVNMYQDYPPHYPQGYHDYYNRGPNDVRPDDTLQGLVKTEFIDEV